MLTLETLKKMNGLDAERSPRNRKYLIVALLATIGLGLASRRFPGLFPAALGKYPGDALWAQMVYWGFGFLAPSASIRKVALVALIISYIDELSQLYQAPWINDIRATPIGHAILGSAFSWGDMLAYTIGIALVAIIEWRWLRKTHPSPSQQP